MVLKRQEKNEKIKAIYSSSNICASTYDKETQALVIIFNNGGQYLYEGVSPTDYTRFEIADSQGVVFNSHIKKYPFQKLDKVNVVEILTEVENLKDSEDKIKMKHSMESLINSMKAMVTYYESTESIDVSQYEKVKKSIEDYDILTSKKDDING